MSSHVSVAGEESVAEAGFGITYLHNESQPCTKRRSWWCSQRPGVGSGEAALPCGGPTGSLPEKEEEEKEGKEGEEKEEGGGVGREERGAGRGEGGRGGGGGVCKAIQFQEGVHRSMEIQKMGATRMLQETDLRAIKTGCSHSTRADAAKGRGGEIGEGGRTFLLTGGCFLECSGV